MITVITYEKADNVGTVRQGRTVGATPSGEAATTIRILNADTAQRVSREPGATTDLYRMLISMPTPDKRYIANYGIVTKVAGAAAAGPSVTGLGPFLGPMQPTKARARAGRMNRLRTMAGGC